MTNEEFINFETFLHNLRGGLSAEELNVLEEERHEVSKAMQKHGGSFVSYLGLALAAADIPNTLIIKTAFFNYWSQYLAVSRAKHLQWCKQRALELCDAGDHAEAMASFQSDMRKHVATRQHPALALMAQLVLMGDLSSASEMGKFIKGFN